MYESSIISNMQHFSTGDGEGIRTTIFFKGCNLSCQWCHNPENISVKKQLLFYPHLCTSCGKCAKVCPTDAHTVEQGKHVFIRERCTQCGECVKNCGFSALALCGELFNADRVMDYIIEDELFYSISGGGVTLSGGEPLLQADFCAQIASRCFDRGIFVNIDTAGCVPYESIAKVIPFTDTFLFDIKGISSEYYKEYTGGDFELVCSNLKRLVREGCGVVVRVPVIPGYNDSDEYFVKLVQLLKESEVKRVDVLPFHRFGASKYTALGMDWQYADTQPPSISRMSEIREILNKAGLICKIDG